MRFVLGLLLGFAAGYCVVLFGWIAYTNVAGSHHFEGAAAMQVAFFFAPLGGLVAGLALGILWQTARR